jgi:ABC-type bacteriocin/lantibiotic exporter with double-glycine peptidase domain
MSLFDYPKLKQLKSNYCGVSATQFVLAYYEGILLNDFELAKKLKTKRHGTEPKEISKFFERRGYKVIYKEMIPSELKSFLKRKIPVILLLTAWGGGHYVVALEYSSKKNEIYFEDSIIDLHKGFMTIDELKDKWYTEDSKSIGIAIYGKKPIYDKNKLVHIE